MDQVSDSDQKLLEAVVGAEAVKDLIELDRLIQTKKLAGASATSVKLPEISDRQKRGTIHQVRNSLSGPKGHVRRMVCC